MEGMKPEYGADNTDGKVMFICTTISQLVDIHLKINFPKVLWDTPNLPHLISNIATARFKG